MEFVVIFCILIFAGLIKGLVGFGEAIIGVSLISLILSPQEAVILMIIPVMVSNMSLVREVEPDTMENLVSNNRVLISSILGGTVLGMFFLGTVSSNLLSPIIGTIMVLYSVVKFRGLNLHLTYFHQIPGKVRSFLAFLLGSLGGFIFGSTSIGALIVIYFEYLELPRKKFLGILGFVFLLISIVRIGFSYYLGYYTESSILYLSAMASIPVFIGVNIGKYIGEENSNELHKELVLLLFLVIGLRLLLV